MKIKYLGTAAAEGVPGQFCDCDRCRKARALGGKEFRTRSQGFVNDELLIDFPADTLCHCLKYGIDLSKLEHLLITHRHRDHLYPEDFLNRKKGYAAASPVKYLHIYAAGAVLERIEECNSDCEEYLKLHKVKAFETFAVGNYEVTALKSLHDPAAAPLFYIVRQEGKALLYAHDTGYFCDETWAYLERHVEHIDLVSLDCTNADVPEMTYDAHMNLNNNVRVKERLTALGFTDEKTVFVCNHFSHNGVRMNYCDFEPIAQRKGFVTSYDGLEIEF